MPETTCPMCGRPAKIVGRTTLHYEPLEAGPASPISFTTGDITTRDTTGQVTECLVEIEELRKRLEAAESDLAINAKLLARQTDLSREAEQYGNQQRVRADVMAVERDAAYQNMRQAQGKAEATEALAGEMVVALRETALRIAFLVSCVRSGEQLDLYDNALLQRTRMKVDALLATDATNVVLARREREEAVIEAARGWQNRIWSEGAASALEVLDGALDALAADATDADHAPGFRHGADEHG
jgi:hypothetical protein